ncbi:protein of unknown function CX domain-containing protein [Aphelenchoides bicaudatus]|nr:protein of unknown function CX domain-containing protein [Aphelenchoides bicaudatus]
MNCCYILVLGCLIYGVEALGSGGRGFSAARSSVSSSASRGSSTFASRGGGSTFSGTASYRGSSYHVPPSSTFSRTTFHQSIYTGYHPGFTYSPGGIIFVHSPAMPFYVHNTNYYFGREHYVVHTGSKMCAVPFERYEANDIPLSTETENPSNSTEIPIQNNTIPPATQTASSQNGAENLHFDFPEGQRPKELVWSCAVDQMCCYLDCCPRESRGSRILMFVVISTFVLVSVFVAYKIFKVVYKSFNRPRQYAPQTESPVITFNNRIQPNCKY